MKRYYDPMVLNFLIVLPLAAINAGRICESSQYTSWR
jgi:hypothetical protein